MRKHGRRGTLTSRFWTPEGLDKLSGRRRTPVSAGVGRQSYKWLMDSGRWKIVKH